MQRLLLSTLISFLLCAPLEAQTGKFSFSHLVDLSYAFDSTTIYWPTEKGFVLENEFAGMNPKGYWYESNKFSAPEHGGTHIDAPIHFAKDHLTVDQIPLDRLIGDGVVIDVSEQCAKNRDYQVQVSDFTSWEQTNGPLPDGAIVLLRTGFGKYWPDRVQYMGTNERGEAAVAKLHFPGLDPETAKWLVANRKIKAIGLDTPSIDYGQSQMFGSHVTLYAHDVPAFENVAHLDELPVKGFTVIAFPMKIKGGSGGPLRIAAIW